MLLLWCDLWGNACVTNIPCGSLVPICNVIHIVLIMRWTCARRLYLTAVCYSWTWHKMIFVQNGINKQHQNQSLNDLKLKIKNHHFARRLATANGLHVSIRVQPCENFRHVCFDDTCAVIWIVLMLCACSYMQIIMSAVLLSIDIVLVFCFTAFIHFHYGSWQKHHILVTLTTFVSWYFPFMIVFVMPIDVSSVSYSWIWQHYLLPT